MERYPQGGSVLPNGAWWLDADGAADHSIERLADLVAESPVDAAVLVQAAGPYGSDNTYLADAVRPHEANFVGACIVDPSLGDDAVAQLVSMAERPGIGGIRLFHIRRPEVPWLAAPAGDRLIDAAAELGLSISVCCLPDDFVDLTHQLTRRPDVAVVLDHCGFADCSGDPPYERATPLWNLTAFPNLHVKFTPTFAARAGGDRRRLLEHVVERFGAERVVWGSDWPQHREHGLDYTGHVAMVKSWMTGLTEAERAAVEGDNALRLWPNAWPQLRGCA